MPKRNGTKHGPSWSNNITRIRYVIAGIFIILLSAFIVTNLGTWTGKALGVSIDRTLKSNSSSVNVAQAENATANNTSSNSNSTINRPNSNVSRLTTTHGNITTNANAPGSPFPPKEANSTSYFPETNKVAIVVGAALLRDKAYQPNPVNVKAGGVVTWNNEDTVVHTVTSGTGLQDPKIGNQFDSGLLGGHFSHIFFKSGVFPYFCQIHPTMVGKVVVK
jgi:plastocyanin